MKIAFISDIHGNVNALQEVLVDADRAGVDQIFNLGDTLGGPLASALTADLLMQRHIPMIAGNHERQLLTFAAETLSPSDACTASEITPAHRAWLASAPPTQWLSVDVFACHGTPSSDLDYWLETITDDFGQHGSPGMRSATQPEVEQRLGHGAHGRATGPPRLGHRAAHGPHDVTRRSCSVWAFWCPIRYIKNSCFRDAV